MDFYVLCKQNIKRFQVTLFPIPNYVHFHINFISWGVTSWVGALHPLNELIELLQDQIEYQQILDNYVDFDMDVKYGWFLFSYEA